jgi:hypothetical protein
MPHTQDGAAIEGEASQFVASVNNDLLVQEKYLFDLSIDIPGFRYFFSGGKRLFTCFGLKSI